MPDYAKSKIYTIKCKTDETLIYVGSTTQQYLSRRWAGHKNRSVKHPNMLIYKTINNNWCDWYIELYESFPCETKEQLLKKEGEIIKLIGNLNSQISGRTKQEYRSETKDIKKETDKKYYENNKEKIKKKVDEYRLSHYETIKDRKNNTYIVCSCGCKINKNNQSQHLKTKKHQSIKI